MEAEVEAVKTESTDLPKGWAWRAMEDVADVIGGATPKTADPAHYEGGNIAWLTPADLSGYTEKYIEQGARFITKKGLESCSTKLLPKGTVLFTSRAPIGYVAIASGEVCTNQGFKSFVLDESQVTSDYVYWWLKGAKSMAEEVASGTTFLELSTAKAKKLPIPVAPLREQRRIVEAIERQLGRLDAAVSRLQAAKAKLKRYKQAVLKAAVEGRLTEEWREKPKKQQTSEELLAAILSENKEVWEKEQLDAFIEKGKKPKDNKWKDKYPLPVKADVEALPELPKGWNWVRIGTIGFVTKLAGFEYTEFVKYDPHGDLSVIKAENASRDGFRPTEFSKVKSETVAHLTRSKLIPGDVLIVFVGSIGNVARVPADQPYFLGPNIGMIRVESKHVLPEYLEYFLRSPIGDHLINSFAKAVTQPSLSMGSIRLIPLAVPPLEEQKQIVAALEIMLEKQSEMDSTLDAQLLQATRLRQAVLRRAFEGKLVAAEVPVIQLPTPVAVAAEPVGVYATKTAAERNRDRHFARMLLSAEVVHQMHAEPEFNDVKHQKVFQLCEYIAQIPEIEGEYKRWRAGAFDNKLFHTNLSELKKQKWYDKSGARYVPLTKAGAHAKYLGRWNDKLPVIQKLLDLLKDKTADQCEIFATAYFAWNDLLIWGREATEDAVFDQVWNHWHESKRRFPESTWRTAIQWMKDKGYAPTGFGKATRQPT